MEKVKVGIIGTGFIGPTHIEAIRRLGFVEVVGLAETSQEAAERKAAELGIPKAYGDYRDMLRDSEIQVVHNCTPNHLHFAINKEIILAGKDPLNDQAAFATFEDGHVSMCITDAILESHEQQKWVKVQVEQKVHS
ncbi:putative dehydrogenase [Bacillus fengqiuensis]|nr:putative dehydrogenase [Bacillus fengqiuensis]